MLAVFNLPQRGASPMPGQSGFFIQFIRLAGPFWSSENKANIRKQTLALMVLTLLQLAITVIITEWSAAQCH